MVAPMVRQAASRPRFTPTVVQRGGGVENAHGVGEAARLDEIAGPPQRSGGPVG